MIAGFFEYVNKFIFNNQGGMFTLLNISLAVFGIGLVMMIFRFVKSLSIFS